MNEIFNIPLSTGETYPYHINSSKRAKHIRIKLSRTGSLSVTIPSKASLQSAHEFVSAKRSWIEKHLKKVVLQPKDLLPEVLNLRLLKEEWKVSYVERVERGVKIRENSNFELLIEGDRESVNDFSLVATAINQWCKSKAKHVFAPMLETIAEIHGFHYHRLSIRAQKTRWGSCSQDKNINLNCKLLFVPENVVKYVMIHELCHTLEMNHSSRFWSLVKECDPNYKEHKLLLKKLSKTIIL